jgi:hypothetical protein
MTAPNTPLTREQRLAARLRENLHRRKAQARAIDSLGAAVVADDKSDLPKPGDER